MEWLGNRLRKIGWRDDFCAGRHSNRLHLIVGRRANLCFGGQANSRQFMAASASDYGLSLNAAGLKGGRNDCHWAGLCLSDTIKSRLVVWLLLI